MGYALVMRRARKLKPGGPGSIGATHAVRTKPQMPYREALRLKREGRLRRAVLTEKGWVA